MLIKFWLGALLFIVIGILITIAGALIAKKLKRNPAGGATIGFFLAFAFVLVMLLGASRFYVVTGDQEYNHYLVYGDAEYKSNSGAIVTVEDRYGWCNIYNETTKTLAVEEVQYGGISFGNSMYYVEPGEMQAVEGTSIDYFWDDSPPDELSVGEGQDMALKLWLRDKRE